MRFKNCTLAYVKKIYMEKMIAIENNDQDKINSLKETYPEIFNAQFMMDVLINEFERVRNGFDDNIIFQINLFKYH